jgi:hypothetical protein
MAKLKNNEMSKGVQIADDILRFLSALGYLVRLIQIDNGEQSVMTFRLICYKFLDFH